MNVRSLALSAIAGAVLGTAMPLPASAGAHFIGDSGSTDVVYCGESTIAGRFSPSLDQYQSQGACAAYRTPPRSESSGQSTFPDPTHAPLLYQANWTATGSYNATTHEVQETVTLPAPTIDQPAPAGRPYGRFTSSMICTTDPWLDRTTGCTGIKVAVAGNLGTLEKTLRQTQRPLSASISLAQLQALVAQHQQRLAALSNLMSATIVQKNGLLAVSPSIVAPSAGATARLGKPLYVRIATSSKKTSTYALEMQRKDAVGNWTPVGTVNIGGAAAEAASGAVLWGTASAPLAGEPPGAYRLRAAADGGPASDWRDFTIAGIATVSGSAGSAGSSWQSGQAPATPFPAPLGSRIVPDSALNRNPGVAPRPTPNWGAAPSALGNR